MFPGRIWAAKGPLITTYRPPRRVSPCPASPLRRPFVTSTLLRSAMTDKTIGTHNGTFHVDEAFACWMLRRLDQFKAHKIVRTRDQALLETFDVLVDVGSVYDHSKQRYDHHQSSFQGTFDDNHPIRLSSAGLVYKHYGKQILAKELALNDEKILEILYQKLYDQFVEPLDAIDNGVNQYETDLKPRYKITTDLSSRVGNLNPLWNQPSSPAQIDKQFEKAMELAGGEFLDKVNYYGKAWLPARSIVDEAMASRFAVHPSGQIAKLASFCPWKDHLYSIEKELGMSDPKELIKYVLYKDTGDSWRVQAVSTQASSFENRLSLPAQWRGLRDDQLSTSAGIPDCVFVHATGFIGGNRTYEGALAMAAKALTM